MEAGAATGFAVLVLLLILTVIGFTCACLRMRRLSGHQIHPGRRACVVDADSNANAESVVVDGKLDNKSNNNNDDEEEEETDGVRAGCLRCGAGRCVERIKNRKMKRDHDDDNRNENAGDGENSAGASAESGNADGVVVGGAPANEYLKPFLFVSTKALERACIQFYDDAEMQAFISAWMTLIGQSERRDASCLNQLRHCLNTKQVSFRVFKKAINEVRSAGIPADGLAEQAEFELLVMSLKKLATMKASVLEHLSYISADGIRRWLADRKSVIGNLYLWFMRVMLKELQGREETVRRALLQNAREDPTQRIRSLPAILFKARQCGLVENEELAEAMIKCEEVALEAVLKNPREDVADGFEPLLTVKGTLGNLKSFTESGRYKIDGKIFHFMMNLLQKIKKKEGDIVARLNEGVAKTDGDQMETYLKEYRKAGISEPGARVVEAECILLDAITEKCKMEGYLEEFVSQFDSICEASLEQGLRHSRELFPDATGMLREFLSRRRSEKRANLENLSKRFVDGNVGADDLRDGIMECRLMGLTAEHETLMRSELKLVEILASGPTRSAPPISSRSGAEGRAPPIRESLFNATSEFVNYRQSSTTPRMGGEPQVLTARESEENDETFLKLSRFLSRELADIKSDVKSLKNQVFQTLIAEEQTKKEGIVATAEPLTCQVEMDAVPKSRDDERSKAKPSSVTKNRYKVTWNDPLATENRYSLVDQPVAAVINKGDPSRPSYQSGVPKMQKWPRTETHDPLDVPTTSFAYKKTCAKCQGSERSYRDDFETMTPDSRDRASDLGYDSTMYYEEVPEFNVSVNALVLPEIVTAHEQPEDERGIWSHQHMKLFKNAKDQFQLVKNEIPEKIEASICKSVPQPLMSELNTKEQAVHFLQAQRLNATSCVQESLTEPRKKIHYSDKKYRMETIPEKFEIRPEYNRIDDEKKEAFSDDLVLPKKSDEKQIKTAKKQTHSQPILKSKQIKQQMVEIQGKNVEYNDNVSHGLLDENKNRQEASLDLPDLSCAMISIRNTDVRHRASIVECEKDLVTFSLIKDNNVQASNDQNKLKNYDSSPKLRLPNEEGQLDQIVKEEFPHRAKKITKAHLMGNTKAHITKEETPLNQEAKEKELTKAAKKRMRAQSYNEVQLQQTYNDGPIENKTEGVTSQRSKKIIRAHPYDNAELLLSNDISSFNPVSNREGEKIIPEQPINLETKEYEKHLHETKNRTRAHPYNDPDLIPYRFHTSADNESRDESTGPANAKPKKPTSKPLGEPSGLPSEIPHHEKLSSVSTVIPADNEELLPLQLSKAKGFTDATATQQTSSVETTTSSKQRAEQKHLQPIFESETPLTPLIPSVKAPGDSSAADVAREDDLKPLDSASSLRRTSSVDRLPSINRDTGGKSAYEADESDFSESPTSRNQPSILKNFQSTLETRAELLKPEPPDGTGSERSKDEDDDGDGMDGSDADVALDEYMDKSSPVPWSRPETGNENASPEEGGRSFDRTGTSAGKTPRPPSRVNEIFVIDNICSQKGDTETSYEDLVARAEADEGVEERKNTSTSYSESSETTVVNARHSASRPASRFFFQLKYLNRTPREDAPSASSSNQRPPSPYPCPRLVVGSNRPRRNPSPSQPPDQESFFSNENQC